MKRDLSQWPTRKQAAELLGVSPKSIERYEAKGLLRRADRRVAGRRPVPVYDPESLCEAMPKNTEDGDQAEVYIVTVRRVR